MKAKLQQFYQDKVQPALRAARARLVQATQRFTAWLNRHEHLRTAAIVLTAGIGLSFLLQWPAMEAAFFKIQDGLALLMSLTVSVIFFIQIANLWLPATLHFVKSI
jgi:hypothetical protein